MFSVLIKSIFIFLTGGLLIVPLFAFSDHEDIFIQSLESKTRDGQPVFNQIQFFPGWDKDVWMMNQSHYGPHPEAQPWERLAIIVDKTGPQKTARFLQLPPGKLKWDESLLKQEVKYRVSCFICHANGPRAIRPDFASSNLSLKNKASLALWNLRIKTYGRIKEDPIHQEKDLSGLVNPPFRHRSPLDNQTLNVKSCTKCHQEGGLVRRGLLTRQNVIAIQYLMETKQMPPPGFTVSAEDQFKIKKFIMGF